MQVNRAEFLLSIDQEQTTNSNIAISIAAELTTPSHQQEKR